MVRAYEASYLQYSSIAAAQRKGSVDQCPKGVCYDALRYGSACVIAWFGLTTASRAEIQGAPEDVAAISAILAENVVALNKHDPVAASRQYMADAEFTNVAGIHVKGGAEIEKFLAAGFTTRLKAASWKPVNTTIRFIRPDVAIVHVTSEISGFLNPDGSTAPPHNEMSIRVFRRIAECGVSLPSTTLGLPRSRGMIKTKAGRYSQLLRVRFGSNRRNTRSEHFTSDTPSIADIGRSSPNDRKVPLGDVRPAHSSVCSRPGR